MTDYSKLTLDELIEAARELTPELDREVSMRVFEAKWKCSYKSTSKGVIDKCGLCGFKTGEYPSYPNDPRLWWPLAERCNFSICPIIHYAEKIIIRDGYLICCENSEGIPIKTEFWKMGAGLAVCLAYLKIKERENEK